MMVIVASPCREARVARDSLDLWGDCSRVTVKDLGILSQNSGLMISTLQRPTAGAARTSRCPSHPRLANFKAFRV